MGGKEIKKVGLLFLLTIVFFVCGQDVEVPVKEKIKLCAYCTCSEISNEDGYVVLNVQCSELDKIESLPDLDKIEWPDNPNGLKVAAAFEGLGLSTLGKLPPNPQVETLRFNNNAIKTYWPDPFEGVPNLKKLSLTTNDLTEITPDLFTKIQLLEELDLSFNKLTNFNSLDFKDLNNLKRLNVQNNNFKTVPIEALQFLNSLEDLDLSRNGIYDMLLERSNSQSLRGVKRLNLAGNRIRSVMESFPENNSLEFLDLSNNIIEMIKEDLFLSCTNLKELNLGQNKITFIFLLPPTLQIAILKQNTLHRWPEFPSGITYIDISYNRLTDLYDENAVNFDNLEFLNIAGNQLKNLNFERKLPKLYNLDLSYNQIEEIPKSLNSQIFPNLEELRLDGNPIHTVYFKNILTVRNLYMNELSQLLEVEDKAFSNVMGRSLEDNCFSLHLANCKSLGDIHEGAFAGTALCFLDLSGNNFTSLSEALLPWRSISGGVDLQQNPWRCSCELQWLLTDLLPNMYERHSGMLTQLRCGSPRAVAGLRLVHWYNWTEPVLCSDYLNTGYRGSYILESTEGPLSLSRVTSLTLILGASIIIGFLISVGLIVYLVKTRRRYQVRQAAMKRKRQSAIDARNSSIHKEQYSALNKV